ncbi:atp synthase gamma-related [Anaeramoeba flamelloides]|uniref:Atp synthase gamma-related n=1 Tax=Anaeramoeba flamelloides TaxID=1746091 RepID=A0AAV8AHC3_9EUKA|nr:atp synthase gamma-related [Anaeramoeba flamelloides]
MDNQRYPTKLFKQKSDGDWLDLGIRLLYPKYHFDTGEYTLFLNIPEDNEDDPNNTEEEYMIEESGEYEQEINEDNQDYEQEVKRKTNNQDKKKNKKEKVKKKIETETRKVKEEETQIDSKKSTKDKKKIEHGNENEKDQNIREVVMEVKDEKNELLEEKNLTKIKKQNQEENEALLNKNDQEAQIEEQQEKVDETEPNEKNEQDLNGEDLDDYNYYLSLSMIDIRPDGEYTINQDSLLHWKEKNGDYLAISFRNSDECQFIFSLIQKCLQIKKQLLPSVNIKNLKKIKSKLEKCPFYDRSFHVSYIIKKGYFKEFYNLFQQLEREPDLPNLKLLFDIYKILLNFNVSEIVRQMFSKRRLLETISIMEYNPNFSTDFERIEDFGEDVHVLKVVKINDLNNSGKIESKNLKSNNSEKKNINKQIDKEKEKENKKKKEKEKEKEKSNIHINKEIEKELEENKNENENEKEKEKNNLKEKAEKEDDDDEINHQVNFEKTKEKPNKNKNVNDLNNEHQVMNEESPKNKKTTIPIEEEMNFEENNFYFIKTKNPNLIQKRIRMFLLNKAKFQPLLTLNPEIIELIHYDFRLRFLKDNILFQLIPDTVAVHLYQLISETDTLIVNKLGKMEELFESLYQIFESLTSTDTAGTTNSSINNESKEFILKFFFEIIKIIKTNQRLKIIFFEIIEESKIFNILQFALAIRNNNSIQIQTIEILIELMNQHPNKIRNVLISKGEQENGFQFFRSLSLLIQDWNVESNVKYLLIDFFRMLLDPQTLEMWILKKRFVNVFCEQILIELIQPIFDFIEKNKTNLEKNFDKVNGGKNNDVNDENNKGKNNKEKDRLNEKNFGDNANHGNGNKLEHNLKGKIEIEKTKQSLKQKHDLTIKGNIHQTSNTGNSNNSSNKDHFHENNKEQQIISIGNNKIDRANNDNVNGSIIQQKVISEEKNETTKKENYEENNNVEFAKLQKENQKMEYNIKEKDQEKETEEENQKIKEKIYNNSKEKVEKDEELPEVVPAGEGEGIVNEDGIQQKLTKSNPNNKIEIIKNFGAGESEEKNEMKEFINTEILQEEDKEELQKERLEQNGKVYDEKNDLNWDIFSEEMKEIERNQVISLLFDLISFCITNQDWRVKLFFIKKEILDKFVILLFSDNEEICLATTRFFKTFLLINDPSCINYSIDHNLWDTIIICVKNRGEQDDMLSSCLLEIFQKLLELNLKIIINFLVENYKNWMKTIKYTEIFKKIIQKDKKNKVNKKRKKFYSQQNIPDYLNETLDRTYFNYYPQPQITQYEDSDTSSGDEMLENDDDYYGIDYGNNDGNGGDKGGGDDDNESGNTEGGNKKNDDDDDDDDEDDGDFPFKTTIWLPSDPKINLLDYSSNGKSDSNGLNQIDTQQKEKKDETNQINWIEKIDQIDQKEKIGHMKPNKEIQQILSLPQNDTSRKRSFGELFKPIIENNIEEIKDTKKNIDLKRKILLQQRSKKDLKMKKKFKKKNKNKNNNDDNNNHNNDNDNNNNENNNEEDVEVDVDVDVDKKNLNKIENYKIKENNFGFENGIIEAIHKKSRKNDGKAIFIENKQKNTQINHQNLKIKNKNNSPQNEKNIENH